MLSVEVSIKPSYWLLLFIYASIGCTPSQGTDIYGLIEGPVRDKKPKLGFVADICSALDFNNVGFPADFTESDQKAFALAMNITGSFEGHKGWNNLSNNFDGQGVSLGILNQNLGQGTLQPLLIELRNSHYAVLQNAMSSTMLSSLLNMLKKWESVGFVEPKGVGDPSSPFEEKEYVENSNEYGDVDKYYRVNQPQTRSNGASVAWAKKTLYTDVKGYRFRPEWKQAFLAIGIDPNYITLQVGAARDLHDRTQEYRTRLGWHQLRSYLFLFDVVVQNGGLGQKHFDKFAEWKANNASASEDVQMVRMLEIRVVDSHPSWQNDVRARKNTIISGKGFVHGEHRNLPLEYCYDPSVPYAFPQLPEEPPVGPSQLQFASP